MGSRFFNVPVRDSEAAEHELNGFLASHKVLSIDRQLVDIGMNSFWAVCVDYLTSPAGESSLTSNLSRSRVDYKTILPQVVQRRCHTRNELAQIEGISEGIFPVGRFYQFLIRDPKEPVITAPCFEELVLHHAIMNICEPIMDRWLIAL